MQRWNRRWWRCPCSSGGAALIVYLVYRIVYCLVKKAVRDALREYEAEKGVALTAKRVETAEPERGEHTAAGQNGGVKGNFSVPPGRRKARGKGGGCRCGCPGDGRTLKSAGHSLVLDTDYRWQARRKF
ncbi:MAG: hypothetical protein V8R75_05035 [Oscillospiraceae bacterium]